MTLKPDILETAYVTAKSLRPHFVGDTLEYNTSSIQLQANASVEELLARLPGVEIFPDGSITFNGQKVQKLLVDGEDIFGSNPAIVTRNFNADMIAKLQLLDKKCALAQFSGIEDGRTKKTLNLVLKEEAKRGYFGKVEGGGGDPNGYYSANGLLGRFRNKQQFVALGMAANTGATGFQDGSSGGLALRSGGNDGLGASAGMGIPRVEAGGAHFADTWDGRTDHVMGNYQFDHLFTKPVMTSNSLQVLPDTVYRQVRQSNSINSEDQHRLSSTYDLVPDSLNSLQLNFEGSTVKGKNQFGVTGSGYFNDSLVNGSYRTIQSNVNNQDFDGQVLWSHKGQRNARRIFTLSAGLNRQDHQTDGYLYSINSFFKPDGTILGLSTTDQRKLLQTNGTTLTGSLSYLEPLWKNARIGFNYGFSFNKGQSLQATYNQQNGKYEDYVDSLSNHYQDRVWTQTAGVSLQARINKLRFTMEGDVQNYSCLQTDLQSHQELQYQYLNFIPLLLTKYPINSSQSFFFEYKGSTQQPGITLLQPVQNNNDPLHITIGNPDLRPGFTHNFSTGFQSFRTHAINIFLNASLPEYTISTRTYTDSLGRQISQPVNVSGTKIANLDFTVNTKIKPLNIDFGLTGNVGVTHSLNYVNSDLSRNNAYKTGGGFSIAKYVLNKYDFRILSNATYFYSTSSINTAAITRYWTQSHTALASFYPGWGLEFKTSLVYTWRQKTSVFETNNSTVVWNAYLNRNFLSNRLAIRASINNILDQNEGISRSIVGNLTSETVSNVVGRYWMVSVIYRFNHQR